MTYRIDQPRALDRRHPSLAVRHVFKVQRLARVQCRHCRERLTEETRVTSRWTDSGESPYCRACHALITAPIVPRHVTEARLSATWSRYAREFGASSAPARAAQRAYETFRRGVQS